MLLLLALLVLFDFTPHHVNLLAADTSNRLRPGAGRHRHSAARARHAATKAVQR
ncbi:hypothetical protein [Streptacidiphilus albus]|uniref:hypothetical protein n=1 Tax=Streptacidiphilus albus TaxID=105425 RepID=UPI000A431770|nr:hypothetical protein [Streptacidiphilus albus]